MKINIFKEIRLAFGIAQKLTINELSNYRAFIADFATLISRYGILILIYWNIFQNHSKNLQDFTFSAVAWSTFFYTAVSILNFKRIYNEFENDVKSGSIEMLLNKPVNYLNYRIYWQFGQRFIRFLVITTCATLVLIIFVGVPESMKNFIFLPTLIPTLILGVTIGYYMYSLIGQLAMWIEDVSGIYRIVDKIVMILGGAYVPVSFFPEILYKIAIYSPFGAIFFVTHSVFDTWKENWQNFIFVQLFWILVLFLINNIVYDFLKKKVLVNGG